MTDITMTIYEYTALRSAALVGITAHRKPDEVHAAVSCLMNADISDKAERALERLARDLRRRIESRYATTLRTVEPAPHPMAQALEEGWMIDVDAETGEYRIVADGDLIQDDDVAADHVRGCAEAGVDYHAEALRWIDQANALVAEHGRLSARPAPRAVIE